MASYPRQITMRAVGRPSASTVASAIAVALFTTGPASSIQRATSGSGSAGRMSGSGSLISDEAPPSCVDPARVPESGQTKHGERSVNKRRQGGVLVDRSGNREGESDGPD